MSDRGTTASRYDTGKDLPLRIYNADDERGVTEAIEENSNRLSWHKLGDTTRNYSVVYNQASDPVGALGELVANSADAILMRRYYEQHGDSYDPKHGLNSYNDARDLLTGDERIEIKATGPKPDKWKHVSNSEKPYAYPNISVLDRGHGQPAEKFEDTIVGFFLPGESKDEFPFTQGRFGMGGSAVLPHSGDRMYKFIASASMDRPGEWTWTLVRDSPDETQRHFEYLKFNDSVATFTGEFEDRQIGTVVGVYDYNFTSNIARSPTEISSRFIELLDREMVRSPVTIRSNELRRGYKDPASATTRGILDKIENIQKSDEKPDLVKRDFTEHHDFGRELGERAVRIVVFRADHELEERGIDTRKKNRFVSTTLQSQESVFFTRNEQTHGGLGMSFLKTRCKKPRVGREMLIFIDFSEFEPLEDLFVPSRDRLTENEISMKLKTKLKGLIKTHDWLTEEEERRRNHMQAEQRDEERSEIVQDIAEENPDLAQLLENGELADVKNTDGDEDSDDPLCDLNRFPSRFEVLTWFQNDEFRTWTSGNSYTQKHPTNKTQVVQFLLDAHDRYFERDDRPGKLGYNTNDGTVKGWSLNSGILTVRLSEPGDDTSPGDTRDITFTVSRQNRSPLQETIEVRYTDPVDYDVNPPGDPDDNSDKKGLPKTIPITEDGRGDTTAWGNVPGTVDESTPVVVLEDSEGITLYVNHDMSAYRNYIARKNLSPSDKDYVSDVWDAGIQLYTTATYYHLQQKHEEIDPTQFIGTAMAGVSVTMLDQHIDDEDLVGAE